MPACASPGMTPFDTLSLPGRQASPGDLKACGGDTSCAFCPCRRDGLPLDEGSLYKIFWTTSYRLTGKRLNPHLVWSFLRCSNTLFLSLCDTPRGLHPV